MIDSDLIPKIEKAFGFELYDWQKEYLLECGTIPKFIRGGRYNGKTFVYCLRLLLCNTDKIKPRDLFMWADYSSSTRYKMWFKEYCLKVNQVLVENGIETRLICD